jgi:hypothetical protein
MTGKDQNMISFKRNNNGEILCRINIVDDGLITDDFLRHLEEQHRCIDGKWFLAKRTDDESEPQLETKWDVPEREVERCMATIRKAGLRGKNEGRIDANTDVPENAGYELLD